MRTWIALLRGINVGGRNAIPMATLATTFESAGCRAVRTYIQSGNVVFCSSATSMESLRQSLGDAVEARFGFRPGILLLSEDEFRLAFSNNPFLDALAEPKSLHFFFLDSPPRSPDLAGIESLALPTERFLLKNSVFYLHAPDGFGRSKLAAAVERKLGEPATARNVATVQKLLEMVGDEGRLLP